MQRCAEKSSALLAYLASAVGQTKHKQAKHKKQLCKDSTLVDGCSLLILLAIPLLAKPVQAQQAKHKKTVQAQRAGGWVFVADLPPFAQNKIVQASKAQKNCASTARWWTDGCSLLIFRRLHKIKLCKLAQRGAWVVFVAGHRWS